MATEIEYAELANRVYNRTDENRTPVPIGWTEQRWIPDTLSGFSAGVYKNGNEIVISFTGTNEGKAVDFLLANVPIGLGATSSQVIEAMKLYFEVKAANPGAKISFTGHSLGGGLASMMAVFFDKQATIFDAAPFELGARNLSSVNFYRTYFAALGYADDAFTAYASSVDLVDFAIRESKVTAVSLQNEVLASLRAVSATIYGGVEKVVSIGTQTLMTSGDPTSIAARVELHSMTLLTCMLRSTAFADAVQKSPASLEAFFDDKLYKRDPQVSQTANFLDKLLIDDMGSATLPGQPVLDRFAADLLRFQGADGVTANVKMRSALTAVAMEYYYFKDAATSTQLFIVQSGAIHFDLNSIGVPLSQIKAAQLLSVAASSTVLGSDPFATNFTGVSAWHIQTGAGSMNWQETSVANDAAIGGAQADVLRSGQGADVLIGGGGDDLLDGGDGNDILVGGAGQDVYLFSGAWGNDTITDSDGLGSIKLGDASTPALTGGKKLLDNVWESDDHSVIYTITGPAGQQNLIIGQRTTPGASTVSGTITVNNWANGQLGISLDGAPAIANPALQLQTGDQTSPNNADVLNGSAAADQLLGLGGNDALGGGAGDDRIEGGDGNDLIAGGAGADILLGGAGNDYITSSGNMIVATPEPNQAVWTAPVAGATVMASGVTWGIYSVGGGAPITSAVTPIPTDPIGTPGDYIDAGTGNDYVLASYGADWVEGGLGDDTLWGLAGNDVMDGGDGADLMVGDGTLTPGKLTTVLGNRHGDDVMDGGAGDDTMVGMGGSDKLLGGLGNDQLLGDQSSNSDAGVDAYAGGDLLDGGDGDDFLVGGGQQVGQVDRLYGGDGNDVLDGDGSAFVVGDAYQGEDELFGEAGNDELVGGGGADYLDGGTGNDVMFGDGSATIAVAVAINGADELDGGDGLDTLVGGGGDDSLWGGNDADKLFGDDITTTISDYVLVGSAHGKDYLDGGAGDDQLVGGGNADELYGGTGNDTLFGDGEGLAAEFQGADYLDGEEGNDHLEGNGGNDTLIGGDGNDMLLGGDGNDTLQGGAGDDQLFGDAGDDVLNGGSGDNYLDGGTGNDTLTGGDGYYNYNTLLGGDGNDRLVGGGGDSMNILWGGNGDDVLVGHGYFSKLDGGAGNDTLIVASGFSRAFGGDGNDVILGGDGKDSLCGDAGDDLINGGEGDNNLDGGAGNDTLVGGSGYDFIGGDDGDDRIEGGKGGGSFAGGAGNDTFIYNLGDGDTRINDGYGINQLVFGAGITPTNVRFIDDDVWANLSGYGGLTIMLNDGSSIYIENVFDTGTGAFTGAGMSGGILFTDGTSWYPEQIKALMMQASASTDQIQGVETDDTLLGLDGDDFVFGRGGNDTIVGGGGNDILDGGVGDDIYVYDLGDGNDLITFDWAGNDAVLFGAGINPLDVTVRNNYGDLVFTIGAQTLGAEQKLSVAAMFTYRGYMHSIENVRFVDGTTWDLTQIKALALQCTTGPDVVVGFNTDDLIVGLAGNDFLDGGEGNDTIDGGDGADTLHGNFGVDILTGGTGDDLLYGDNTSYLDSYGIDDDTLDGGLGNDYMYGGMGSDTYLFGRGDGQDVIENSINVGSMPDSTPYKHDVLQFKPGVISTDVTLSRIATDLVISINGTSDIVTIRGYYNGTDSLGVYYLGSPLELIKFVDGTSWDYAAVQAHLGSSVLLGTVGADALIGTGGTDKLFGFAGDDELDGGLGADTMIGGLGNDSYAVDIVTDVVVENANEGVDTVTASVSYTLGDNVENLALDGTENIDGTGNALVNYLIGNAGNNVLDGGLDADTMIGGLGNDSYAVDVATDVVVENVNEGVDTVTASVSYSLADNVENLTLDGSANLNGTGNGAANTLTGNAGNNMLDGGAGADTMAGGMGNDTYVVDNVGDSIAEAASAGTDLVIASLNWTLGANLENLTLSGTAAINGTGNGVANTIIGNSGINLIDGGVGADTMVGGLGNDSYVVDNVADVITENANEGVDTVSASVTYALAANVENLTLTGTAAINGAGNNLDNVLTGNSAANVLTGGAGNDTYVVGAGDTTSELAGGGVDTVQTAVAWTLGLEVENLTLTGTAAVNGTGNALNNTILGNAAANSLSGGAGADTMAGGAGNDTYVVDNAADVVQENTNEGTDLVQASVTYALSANVENLTLTGTTAINAVGNVLNNTLTGNTANNLLDGGVGVDTLVGGLGDDTYYVDNAGDITTETASAGIDTVVASLSWTLATNLENLTLSGAANINGTGNAAANVLTGNAGDNVLNGGAGADTMLGGLGNDTYMVDSTTDVVTEGANAGTDLVSASATYSLLANVENLTLTGTAAINGTGNSLDNVLTGNSAINTLTGGAGNDRLDGLAGADKLLGGLGNDTYVVDNAGDVITENLNEGTDSVQASVTHTLAANVENLTLTGAAAINGTGNALDNVLLGNAAINTLTSGAGNDTLDGKAGADSLVGGAGNDTYLLGRGYGVDTVTENDTTAGNTDIARFDATVATNQLWFTKVGNNLEVSIIGTTDKLVMSNWYLGNQYHVEQFKSGDGKTLLDSQVQNLVSAMAGFTPPAAGVTTLPANYATSLQPVLAASWV